MINYRTFCTTFGIVLGIFSASCTKTAPSAPETSKTESKIPSTVAIEGLYKLDELKIEVQEQWARLRLVGIFGFDQSAQDPVLQMINVPVIKAAEQYFKGKKVELELLPQKKDSFDRFLGIAKHAGKDIREKIIGEGWAVVYTEYPDKFHPKLFELEATARKEKKGLWSQEHVHKLAAGLRRQWRDARIAAQRGDLIDPLIHQIVEVSEESKTSAKD